MGSQILGERAGRFGDLEGSTPVKPSGGGALRLQRAQGDDLKLLIKLGGDTVGWPLRFFAAAMIRKRMVIVVSVRLDDAAWGCIVLDVTRYQRCVC